MSVTCPKCKSDKVISTDNQPLYHPKKYKEGEMNFDNEVYVQFECIDCREEFNEVFDMVHRPKPPKVEQRYAVEMKRISFQSNTIHVIAVSHEDAKKIARNIAGDFEYKEDCADYDVENVYPDPLK